MSTRRARLTATGIVVAAVALTVATLAGLFEDMNLFVPLAGVAGVVALVELRPNRSQDRHRRTFRRSQGDCTGEG